MRQIPFGLVLALSVLHGFLTRPLRWATRPGRLRVLLTLLLVPVFVTPNFVSVPPQIAQPVAPAHAAMPPAPNVPNDPLARPPIFSKPFVSLSVDVRTGHLQVRIVSADGPGLGQAGKIVATLYNNVDQDSGRVAGHTWKFNYDLTASNDALYSPAGKRPLEFDHDEPVGTGRWGYYRPKAGAWFLLKLREKCVQPAPGDPCEWVYDNSPYYQYLQGGGYREFDSNGRLLLERDGSGNQTTYDYASGVRITDPIGRVTAFNAATNPTAATDPYGRTVQFTYDASGRLTSGTTIGGATVRFAYTSGLLTRLTDARGNAYSIEYNADGRVTAITYPDGSRVTYAYNEVATLVTVAVTDPRGNTSAHRIVTAKSGAAWGGVVDPLGNLTDVRYDADGNIDRITDPLGRVTTFSYNAHRFLTRITNTQGKSTAYTYDANDNLTSFTDPLGRVTRFEYDANRRLIRVTNALNQTTAYTHTSWGDEATVTDARGNTTAFEYDGRRRPVRAVPPSPQGPTTYGYDQYDNRTTVTDALGRTITAAYDDARRPTSIADALGNVARYAYDANGNRTTVTDPKGQTTTYAYDSRDQLTAVTQPGSIATSYAYDAAGNLTQITLPNGRAVQMAYDARNDVTRLVDALGQVTRTTYDAVGNVATVTDRTGVATVNTYDNLYRLVSEAAGGQSVSYTYDDAGNRLAMSDPTGTTAYQYDALNRLSRVTWPDGRFIAYAYDAVGDRATMINPAGQTTSYAYDAANRITTVTDPTGTTTFGYDAAGNRTALTLSNGTTSTYTYNANNWLANLINRDRSGGVLSQFAYAYDPDGNRTQIVDQSGTSAFTYDALNQLVQASYPDGKAVRYIYDAVGNRTQMAVNSPDTAPPSVVNTSPSANATQVPVNTQIAVHFSEPVDRATLVMTASPGITFGDPAWSNGDRTATFNVGLNAGMTYTVSARARDTAGNLMLAAYTWSFNTAAPPDSTPPVLTNVVAMSGSTTARVTWTTDEPSTSQVQYGTTTSLGTWTALDVSLVSQHKVSITGLTCGGARYYYRAYSRDAAGNTGNSSVQSFLTADCSQPAEPPTPGSGDPPLITGAQATGARSASALTTSGPTTAEAEPTGTTTYAYDANNRLTQRIGPDGTTTFTYDANGNLLRYAEPSGTRTFTYDPWDRLTSVTSGAVTVTYTYDGAGQKVRRQSPAGAVRYYYDYFADVPRILAEADAGSGTFQTIYQRDLFGTLLSDGLTWVQHDGLGSGVTRTNSSGAHTGSTLYGAWGTVRTQSGDQGKWGFTGAEWDPDAKGYHIGARWYDPSLGRWWAEDPKVDNFNPASLNLYAYVYNRPVTVRDPDGSLGCGSPEFSAFGGAFGAGGEPCLFGAAGGFGGFGAGGAAAGAGGFAGAWGSAVSSFLGETSGTSVAFAVARSIARFGILLYSKATDITRGFNHAVEAHHIIPQKLHALVGSVTQLIHRAVVLPLRQHTQITMELNDLVRDLLASGASAAQALQRLYSFYVSRSLQQLAQVVLEACKDAGVICK